jgi:hypothetical protein
MPRLSTSLYTLELRGLKRQRSWMKQLHGSLHGMKWRMRHGLTNFEVGFDTKLEDHDNFKNLQPLIYYN